MEMVNIDIVILFCFVLGEQSMRVGFIYKGNVEGVVNYMCDVFVCIPQKASACRENVSLVLIIIYLYKSELKITV